MIINAKEQGWLATAAVAAALLSEGDPLGVDDFATHHVPLEEAPQAYMNFREKKEGTVKVLLKP